MAIIEINYYYEAEALLKGKRKPRNYLFENSVFLDIPEYNGVCETVAILLDGLERNNMISDNDVIVTPYIKHDEKLWTPFIRMYGDANDQCQSSDNFSECFKKEISELFCYIKPENLLFHKNITIEKPTKILSLNPNYDLSHLQIKMENNEKTFISNIQSENDIKTLISDNKTYIENLIRQNVKGNLYFLNGQLYRSTNGPLRNLQKGNIVHDIEPTISSTTHANSTGIQYNVLKQYNKSSIKPYVDYHFYNTSPINIPLNSAHSQYKLHVDNALKITNFYLSNNDTTIFMIKDLDYFNTINNAQKNYFIFDYLTKTGLQYILNKELTIDYKTIEKHYSSKQIFEDILDRSSNKNEVKEAICLCEETHYTYNSLINLIDILKRTQFSKETNKLPKISHNKTNLSSDHAIMNMLIRETESLIFCLKGDCKENLFIHDKGNTVDFDEILNQKKQNCLTY